MTWVYVVLLWQLALVVGWVVARRLRRLEKYHRPPWSRDLGRLREMVIELHDTGMSYAQRHGRRLYAIEASLAGLELEARKLAKQLDELSDTLAEVGKRVGDRVRRGPSASSGNPRTKE